MLSIQSNNNLVFVGNVVKYYLSPSMTKSKVDYTKVPVFKKYLVFVVHKNKIKNIFLSSKYQFKLHLAKECLDSSENFNKCTFEAVFLMQNLVHISFCCL